MAHWLYQMSTDYCSNWTIGSSKRKPTDVQPGDIVILFLRGLGRMTLASMDGAVLSG